MGDAMRSNTWPDGIRRALHQHAHAQWNANQYPGTRQLCEMCHKPTGRCEEDSMTNVDGLIVCVECYVPSEIEVES